MAKDLSFNPCSPRQNLLGSTWASARQVFQMSLTAGTESKVELGKPETSTVGGHQKRPIKDECHSAKIYVRTTYRNVLENVLQKTSLRLL